jgi:hypothetical protein
MNRVSDEVRRATREKYQGFFEELAQHKVVV